MSVERRKLILGLGLLAAFLVVLAALFMPLFSGQNALDYLDALFNSISKGSAYYVPQLEGAVAEFEGKQIEMSLAFENPERAEMGAILLENHGARVRREASELRISGDFGRILRGCLEDSTDLFQNDDARIQAKYGRDGRDVLLGWWLTLKAMDKDLKRQAKFAESNLVITVKKKSVECAYNYYGIEPRKISDNIGIVLLSLVFYVVYTIWYGYAVILIFEGCGLKLSH
jgi:hypothetical protein